MSSKKWSNNPFKEGDMVVIQSRALDSYNGIEGVIEYVQHDLVSLRPNKNHFLKGSSMFHYSHIRYSKAGYLDKFEKAL